MKEIPFKEYEPQKAKKRIFKSLQRLSKMFLEKERKIFVHILWLRFEEPYEWNSK